MRCSRASEAQTRCGESGARSDSTRPTGSTGSSPAAVAEPSSASRTARAGAGRRGRRGTGRAYAIAPPGPSRTSWPAISAARGPRSAPRERAAEELGLAAAERMEHPAREGLAAEVGPVADVDPVLALLRDEALHVEEERLRVLRRDAADRLVVGVDRSDHVLLP